MNDHFNPARPFRFEDLNGRPEPEEWGPVYPKSGFADDGWTQYRAKIRARFHAQAAADRLAWATGKVKSKSVGERELTIEQVYARAMEQKRALAT